MTDARTVQIGNVAVSNRLPLTLIAGPCQLEGRDHALAIAETLAEACAADGTGFIFKSSYDKANRTSLSAQRGLGMDEGLSILAEVRARIGCPVLTDVHLPDDCAPVAAGRRRPANPRLPLPADRPAARRRRAPAPRSTSRRASSSPPGTW